jgi:formylglycine-generating enzyme required for sulfatase activity/Flp pilus assembly protein TadD
MDKAAALLKRIRAGAKLRETHFTAAEKAQQGGDLKEAVRLYTELLERDALAGARFPTFAVHLNRANVHISQGDFFAAVKDFDRVLELDPEFASGFYNRGSAYALLGRYDLAARDYTQVILLSPDHAAAFYNRGSAHAHQLKFKRAIADYEKALELRPGWEKAQKALLEVRPIARVYGRFEQGVEAEKRHDFDQAIEIYNDVLTTGKLNPRNAATVYYARARIHARRKNYPETLSDLKRAVELYPEWPALQETLKVVEEEARRDEEAKKSETDLVELLSSPPEFHTPASGMTSILEIAESDEEEQAEPTEQETTEEAVAEVAAPQAEEKSGPSEAELEAMEKRRQKQLKKALAEYPAGKVFRDCEQCPEMVVMPMGSYWMGYMDVGHRSETPAHKVIFDYIFAAGKFEVTYEQWDLCVEEKGCSHRPDDDGLGRGNRPVAGINWDDAQAYLAWLSAKTRQQYRLLTEAEWEYMARGGTRDDHFWRDPDKGCEYSNSADQALKEKGVDVVETAACSDGHVKAAPVGSYRANPYGFHDVLGNLSEWVEDCWKENYREAPADGSAETTGECNRRILRGGSWKSAPVEIRASSRVPLWKELRVNTTGLRVARTLFQQSKEAVK